VHVDGGDQLVDGGSPRSIQNVDDLLDALSSMCQVLAQTRMAVVHDRAVTRINGAGTELEQPLDRAEVLAERAGSVVYDRRAASEYQVAGEQRPGLIVPVAKAVTGVARRLQRDQRTEGLVAIGERLGNAGQITVSS